MKTNEIKRIGADLLEMIVMLVALSAIVLSLNGDPDIWRLPLMLGFALAVPALAGAALKLGRDLRETVDHHHHHGV